MVSTSRTVTLFIGLRRWSIWCPLITHCLFSQCVNSYEVSPIAGLAAYKAVKNRYPNGFRIHKIGDWRLVVSRAL